MALGPEQLNSLNRTRLISLVRSHFSDLRSDEAIDGVTVVSSAGCSALSDQDGDGAAVLISGPDPARRLGQGLALLRPQDRTVAPSIRVVVDADVADVAIIARRAKAIAAISSVWRLDGNEPVAVEAAPSVIPASDFDTNDPHALTLKSRGVDVLVDDGALIGEVLGLEIARVVTGPDGHTRLDVGVGEYDQSAFALMHGGLGDDESLQWVIDEVTRFRRPDAAPHPINRFARERWLRSLVCANPAAVGLQRLTAVPALVATAGIRDPAPVLAIGTDPGGAVVGVVCSTGIDLDLVPTSADAIETFGLDRVVIVLVERDRHPVTEALASWLRVPVEFADAQPPWPT